jgi:hypothetical protein
MTTLFASNRIASLERHLGIAVSAEVVDRGTLDVAGLELVAGWDGDGDLVTFTRCHVCDLVFKGLDMCERACVRVINQLQRDCGVEEALGEG